MPNVPADPPRGDSISRRQMIALVAGGISSPVMPAEQAAAGPSGRLSRLLAGLRQPAPQRLCFERARLMTASYRQSEGDPEPVRRARALHDVLDGMPIRIAPDEWIVGNVSSEPSLPYFAPETFAWQGYTPGREYVLGDPRLTSGLQIRYRIPEEIAEYWRGKPWASTVGHFVPDYDKVLRLGFRGIREEAANHRQQWKRRGELDPERDAFYEAAEIACRSAETFALRHAAQARALARRETDSRRREELESIARICSAVPAAPARSFHEALQSFWFTHVILHISSPEWSISPGRFDQYMWPYYRRDIAGGVLRRAEAEELLECLWVKFNEVRINSVDFINYQNLIVGGTDADGEDVTNELSHLCMDITRRVPFTQPSLSLRWHPRTPGALLERACRLILTGCGRPALFNDVAVVGALESAGIPLREARGYAIGGCEEPSVPGLMFGVGHGGLVNQAQCLLTAMERLARAGTARDFEDVCRAYKEEVRRESLGVISGRVRRGKQPETPQPFAALLFDDCLARGRGLRDGGVRHYIPSNSEAGTITAANSLFAIRRAVFEEKLITLPELVQVLARNYEGHEKLRAHLLHQVPKFGNDFDEIDTFARRIAEWNDEVLAETGRGGIRHYTGSGISTAFFRGISTGATPDGRLKGTSLSVSLGPSPGTDLKGPTAMLNSVAKLNWRQQAGGALTSVRLPYTGSQDPTSARALAALAAVFFRKGGMGLHFTVVDAAALRAALKEPEKHLDLMVRVGGFSAPFVLLSADLQQSILERTEQSLER